MDFSDIREMIERYLPIFLKAKGVKFELTFPTKKSVLVTTNFEGKIYKIKAWQAK